MPLHVASDLAHLPASAWPLPQRERWRKSAKSPCTGFHHSTRLPSKPSPYSGMILASMDAKRSELYAGLYQAHGSSMSQVGGYLCVSKENLLKEIEAHQGPWILVGETNPHQSFLLDRIPNAREAGEGCGIVKASSIGRLAYQRQKELAGDLHLVSPLYLRASQAEVERGKVAKTR